MSSKGDSTDPKGLIYESYRMEEIGVAECRSIFLDWALSLPDGVEAVAAIRALLAQYGSAHPDHPMTGILTEGARSMASPRRRGGWRTRNRD